VGSFHTAKKTKTDAIKLRLIVNIGMAEPENFLPDRRRRNDKSGKTTAANESKHNVLPENSVSSI
jgi:hypothetical protein